MKPLTEGVLVGTLIAICIWIGFTMSKIEKISDDIHTIAMALESQRTENVSYITTPQVTINDVKWDVAETTD